MDKESIENHLAAKVKIFTDLQDQLTAANQRLAEAEGLLLVAKTITYWATQAGYDTAEFPRRLQAFLTPSTPPQATEPEYVQVRRSVMSGVLNLLSDLHSILRTQTIGHVDMGTVEVQQRNLCNALEGGKP